MSLQNDNGRIGKLDYNYKDYDANPETPEKYLEFALKGTIGKTPVSELFFSQTNIDALQVGLINSVLNATCGKTRIGKQSTNELLTIMRGIFLQNSKVSRFNVVEQVKELNTQVIRFCVPKIISELKMHEKYLSDITTLPQPIGRGENTSVYGMRTQEFGNVRFL